jgi:hypothetical protein
LSATSGIAAPYAGHEIGTDPCLRWNGANLQHILQVLGDLDGERVEVQIDGWRSEGDT